MKNRRSIVLVVLIGACEPEPEPPAFEPPPLRELGLREGYPVLAEPCIGPVVQPTHLLVTSTDFSTGAVGLVEIATREVQADLALASTDAVPTVWAERAFVINRFGYDWIDELDPRAQLELVHEFPIQPTSLAVSANPQALVFDPAGRAWISLYGAPELQVWQVPLAGAVEPLVSFDMAEFADADGVPELGSLIACGELVFAVGERIDRESWAPADDTWLIPIATTLDAEALFEFDSDHAGPDAIDLLGTGFGAWRLDPSDPSGHTILVLDSGLERIDLAAGTSEWLIPESEFAALGLTRLHLAGFDLDDQGRAWIAAATPNFAEYRIYTLDLVEVVTGLHSVSGELEIVGDELWFADTTLGSSGLRVFDLASVEATEIVEFEFSPVAVGLPPLGLAPIRIDSP